MLLHWYHTEIGAKLEQSLFEFCVVELKSNSHYMILYYTKTSEVCEAYAHLNNMQSWNSAIFQYITSFCHNKYHELESSQNGLLL